jgi:uncharacterized protein
VRLAPPAGVSNLRNLALGMGAAAAATLAYAVAVEPRWLQRTQTRLHFGRLPAPLEGLRIALLTDIHASAQTPRRLVARAVRLTQASQPDLIAVTGDIAESEAALEETLDALAQLSAPLGVYIVPGNHDYRDVGIERWHDAVARRSGLTDLTNRALTLQVGGADDDVARLCIVGVDDLAHGKPHMDGLPPARGRDFTILLAHHPDQAERARRAADNIDLVLSGHTHGGQVRLPWLGALVNSAAHPNLYDAGVRRRPWTQVYTSRGIGTTHMRVRFFSRPEIALLTLTGATRPARRPDWRLDWRAAQRPVS